MKKIKRHLSLTLRNRDSGDALVKKDDSSLSPFCRKSSNKTKSKDLSHQYLIADTLESTKLKDEDLENDNIYYYPKDNRYNNNGQKEFQQQKLKFSLSPRLTSFIKRTNSNSRLLSPPNKPSSTGSSKHSSNSSVKNNSVNSTTSSVSSESAKKATKDPLTEYTNLAYNGELAFSDSNKRTQFSKDCTKSKPELRSATVSEGCILQKSRSFKYPSNTQCPRATTLQRSKSVGPSARFRMSPEQQSKRSTNELDDGFGRIESYTKLEKLGEGTYATVYKGRSCITGMMVALKETRLEHEEGAPCTAIREVSLLKGLKHANIVTLHDLIHTPKSLTLIFEYVDRDLKQYMDACCGKISLYNVRLFVYQLLRGLEYCHRRKVLHRDLKPQNLLIGENGELKLADFGLARAKSVPTKTYSHEVVTLWYRPPDVLLGSTDYSTPIDMWGVGCIFFEMCTAKALFPGSTVEEELYLIFKTRGIPTEGTWPGITTSPEFLNGDFPKSAGEPLVQLAPRLCADGLDLMEQFLKYPPRWRINAKEAMHHPWFRELPKEVHTAADTMSIFSIPGVSLQIDPIAAPDPSFSRDRKERKSRRAKASTTTV